MKIGVLGSGSVGRTLATAFLQEGHQVKLGTREPQKAELLTWKSGNAAASIGSFAETAAFGEILVLAVKGDIAAAVLDLAGHEHFTGKLVIDTCNPISKIPPTEGVLHFFSSLEESLMETLQKKVPGAHFVKAFNSVGALKMYKPGFKEGRPSMFICGNESEAKNKAAEILNAFGWDVEDMGKVEAARAIEPLCMLWCIPGFLNNQWSHAFKLLKN